MFCPKCGSEYRPGFFECSECNVRLTKESPSKSDHGNLDIVTVLKTGDSFLVNLAKTLLDDSGIRCFIVGGQVSDIFGLNSSGSAFEIQVYKNNEEDAKKILIDLIRESDLATKK